MKYDVSGLIFNNAYVQGGLFRGESLELTFRNVLAQEGSLCLDRLLLVISGFSFLRAQSVSRKALGVNNTVKQIKGRQLYKSELAGFISRIAGEEWDVVSWELSPSGTVSVTLCFGDGGLFSFTARCSGISAVSDSPGEKVPGYGKGSRKGGKFPRFLEIFSKTTSIKKH